MSKSLVKTEIVVNENKVSVLRVRGTDYISLTDLARYVNPTESSFTIKDWTRRADTINFIGLWEKLHNPDFNLGEFGLIKTEYGVNKFYMSPNQWVRQLSLLRDNGWINKLCKG